MLEGTVRLDSESFHSRGCQKENQQLLQKKPCRPGENTKYLEQYILNIDLQK